MARASRRGPRPGGPALRGYLRLVSTPSARTSEEVAAGIAAALDTAWRAEERVAALSALQKYPCTEALTLARTLVDDPEVADEARVAVESLEESLSYRR